MTEKRREAKGKGEKKKHTHLNVEFQRIARDISNIQQQQAEIRKPSSVINAKKKKKIEENRMEKTRDLFKTIRDTKGTFHAKMDPIKDRSGMGLTETKILRRGGKNTQKNYSKQILTTQIITIV